MISLPSGNPSRTTTEIRMNFSTQTVCRVLVALFILGAGSCAIQGDAYHALVWLVNVILYADLFFAYRLFFKDKSTPSALISIGYAAISLFSANVDHGYFYLVSATLSVLFAMATIISFKQEKQSERSYKECVELEET